MSRDANVFTQGGQIAAASAGTAYVYVPIPVAIDFEGFSWNYNTAEANTDNTLDFIITADTAGDGTWATTLHTNANPFGLLDTTAVGVSKTNYGDAAVSGQTAVAVSPTVTRVAAGATIRVALTTAGTSTIPAINFFVHGHTLTPLR